jgi:hypothetical protein
MLGVPLIIRQEKTRYENYEDGIRAVLLADRMLGPD